MEMTLKNGFQELSFDELQIVDGGGQMALFLSSVGLAVSPAVTLLSPVSGAALFCSCLGVFVKNY